MDVRNGTSIFADFILWLEVVSWDEDDAKLQPAYNERLRLRKLVPENAGRAWWAG